MKRVLLATAALVAAVVVLTFISLPPKARLLDTSWSDGSVPGALHIHTNRSDGRSGPDEIAAAAARAGLKFIVFADHGDGTREPEPPTYRSGVLCLDGVEISTTGGHYLAMDMDAAPYPLGGEPRGVVADVQRLGGFGIAAHPDSPKAELRWNDWDAPIDGIELINPDTSWRVRVLAEGWRSKLQLLRALITYPVRSSETLGALLTDSHALPEHWNTLSARRRVVGTAGVDAHAKLELRALDPGDNRYSLPIPSYESSFRSLSVHVVPESPLNGNAAADAVRVMEAVRNGRLYTVIDAWASPAAFEFTATNAKGMARSGEALAVGGPVSLRVRSNAPAGFLTTVWRGSEPLVRDKAERDFTVDAGEDPAVYRVEIRAQDRPERPPWIISNPIYVRGDETEVTPAVRPAAARQWPLFDGHSTAGWTRENDSTSVAAIDAVQMVNGTELRFRYGLSGGSVVGQYAGAAIEIARGLGAYERLVFTARAEQPMRISVQVRAEFAGAPSKRWQRSVYLDPTESEHTVSFADMDPVGTTDTDRVIPESTRAIMFIVDTTNTMPGASGRIWFKNVRLER